MPGYIMCDVYQVAAILQGAVQECSIQAEKPPRSQV